MELSWSRCRTESNRVHSESNRVHSESNRVHSEFDSVCSKNIGACVQYGRFSQHAPQKLCGCAGHRPSPVPRRGGGEGKGRASGWGWGGAWKRPFRRKRSWVVCGAAPHPCPALRAPHSAPRASGAPQRQHAIPAALPAACFLPVDKPMVILILKASNFAPFHISNCQSQLRH